MKKNLEQLREETEALWQEVQRLEKVYLEKTRTAWMDSKEKLRKEEIRQEVLKEMEDQEKR